MTTVSPILTSSTTSKSTLSFTFDVAEEMVCVMRSLTGVSSGRKGPAGLVVLVAAGDAC
jgi:hypothetical protein